MLKRCTRPGRCPLWFLLVMLLTVTGLGPPRTSAVMPSSPEDDRQPFEDSRPAEDAGAVSMAFTSLQDLAVLTEPTEIRGRVDGQGLQSWQLRTRGVGEPEWIELAGGRGAVDGKLGIFDPTLLLNGLHELQMVVTDARDHQVTETLVVVVEGQLKLGHLQLRFVDVSLSLAGFDIEVARTYDSRQAHLQGDFGYGWSLDVRHGSYRHSKPLGRGWQLRTTEGPWGSPCSPDAVEEPEGHLTAVRLSDREIYYFRPRLQDLGVSDGGCSARLVFEAVRSSGPGAELEVLGSDAVFYPAGDDTLLDPVTLDPYAPQEVRLALPDGRIVHLHGARGVTRLEDLSGNALIITPQGITHSGGRKVTFERDAEGRITRVVDPMGQGTLYRYSSSGDLTTVVDRIGHSARYVYGEGHRLRDWINGLGVRTLRAEYAGGRLVRKIDGLGHAIAMQYQPVERRQLITDRLGFQKALEYDRRGNVVRETDGLGRTTRRVFDDHDNLLSETDALGRTTSYTYTASHQVASRTDPLGHVRRTAYNERLQPVTVWDARGGVTRHTYDRQGHRTKTIDAAGGVTTYAHDGAGNVVQVTDPLGHRTEHAYDAHGHRIETVDALGHVITYAYDVNGRRIAERRLRILPDGTEHDVVTAYGYDGEGRLTQIVAADGGVTSWAYDAAGHVVRETDPLGRVTAFTYDAAGRRIETVYLDGAREHQAYDAEGRLIRRIDRGGRSTDFTRDAAGQLTETTYADGAVVSQRYDMAGQLVEVTNALGHRTVFRYDAAGRRVAVTDALGQTSTRAYDPEGHVVAETDALGYTVQTAYDPLGRSVRITQPDGTFTATSYDALGRTLSERDAAGQTTGFTYDALGNLTSVVDALGQVTAYGYDALGHRVRQVDVLGRTTRFEYDPLGRPTAQVLPDGARATRAYALDGGLLRQTTFGGETSTYRYDDAGRLSERTLPDGTVHGWTYTATGQRASATDARGTTRYAYDPRDRLVEKTDPNGHRLSYTYDLEGHRTSLSATVDTWTATTHTTYDPLGRAVEVTDPADGVSTADYDVRGDLVSLAFANGITSRYGYDAQGRLVGQTTVRDDDETVLQSFAYTLGPAGHRLAVQELEGVLRQYAYDPLHRLVAERVSSAEGFVAYEDLFSYDGAGNRLTQTRRQDGKVKLWRSVYDERDRLRTREYTQFIWSDDGHLKFRNAGPSLLLTWGADSGLRRVELEDGTVVQHVYDVDGNRAQTTVTEPDEPPVCIDYLVDASGPTAHVVAETIGSHVLAHYTRLGDRLLSLLRPGSEQQRWVHADGQGSVRLLTHADGFATDRYAYFAFGELLEHWGEDPQPYRFRGAAVDASTGFLNVRGRWLDPAEGRYVSLDPSGDVAERPVSLHPYVFAQGDPVNGEP